MDKKTAQELAEKAGITWLTTKDIGDELLRFAELVAEDERKACAECVPTNWCDPMLTGPDAVAGKIADCRPIEALLYATRARIMARSNTELKCGAQAPEQTSDA